jgi:hypothetical protein
MFLKELQWDGNNTIDKNSFFQQNALNNIKHICFDKIIVKTNFNTHLKNKFKWHRTIITKDWKMSSNGRPYFEQSVTWL